MKQSPKERIDTAHAGARALQIVAHCFHHRPDHNLIHKAANAAHQDICRIQENVELLPNRFWHTDIAFVDPAMRVEHILCSVCQRRLPPLAMGVDIGRSHESAIQAQPPKRPPPCSPSRCRTRQRFSQLACLGYFLHHAIMVASRQSLSLCRRFA